MAGGGGTTFASMEVFTINAQAVNHVVTSINAGFVLGGSVAAKRTLKPELNSALLMSGGVTPTVVANSARIEKKTYLYKVYDEDDNFIGVWDDVIDEPNWTQELNSAGSTTTVILARNSDSQVVALDPLLDTSSAEIVDTSSDPIYTINQSPQRIGPGSNVNHNFRVEIWAYYGANPADPLSTGAPNGILKFTGFISEINSRYGNTENTEVQLTSYGYDLDQYPVTSGKLLTNGHFNVDLGGWTPYNTSIARDTAQKHSGLASMRVYRGTQDYRVVYLQTPAWLPANVTVKVIAWVKCVTGTGTFGVGQGGTTAEAPASVAINSTSWTRCEFTVTTGSSPAGNLDFFSPNNDFWIDDVQAYAISPASNTSTTVAYNSYDPARILVEGFEQFKLNSGNETYTRVLDTTTESTIEPTYTVASYTFKVDTYKDLIDKVVQLAPSGYFYYVDLATNLLHFKKSSTTPDHVFYLGKHIKTLSVRSFSADVVNDVLFTGGGSPALYRRYTRVPQTGTRRGLRIMSDDRVTLTESADILADGELDEHENVRYRSTIEILDTTYDIERIKLGDIVTFRNFGNYVDGLQMQIVGLSYTPDAVTLQLDTMPPSVSKRLEDIRRALRVQENSDAPTTPS